MTQTELPPGAPGPGMVQCQVTGKWVREEDTVVIQGYRVCAEGKAQLLEQLKSGGTVPGQLERPRVLLRFVALFIDGLILGPVAIAVMIICGGVAVFTPGGAAGALVALGVAGLINTTINIVYFGLMHGLFGQSLGKMAAGLVVVNMNGSKIDTATAFKRAVVYAGPGLFAPVMTILHITSAATIFNFLFVMYWLATVIIALVDSKTQRPIHDLVAGTRVVVKSSLPVPAALAVEA